MSAEHQLPAWRSGYCGGLKIWRLWVRVSPELPSLQFWNGIAWWPSGLSWLTQPGLAGLVGSPGPWKIVSLSRLRSEGSAIIDYPSHLDKLKTITTETENDSRRQWNHMLYAVFDIFWYMRYFQCYFTIYDLFQMWYYSLEIFVTMSMRWHTNSRLFSPYKSTEEWAWWSTCMLTMIYWYVSLQQINVNRKSSEYIYILFNICGDMNQQVQFQ